MMRLVLAILAMLAGLGVTLYGAYLIHPGLALALVGITVAKIANFVGG